MADSKTRILVVDDAALVRLYYRQILEGELYEVDEALNGMEALERLLTYPADLLIVDINMPHVDGLTFLRTLRQQDSAVASTPAMVTSTENRPQDFAAVRAAGANFYLPKPVSRDSLLVCVGLLSGHAARSQSHG